MNKEYLENRKELFDIAVEEGLYITAKSIADSVAQDFPEEGRILNQLLQLNPLSKFAVVSPY